MPNRTTRPHPWPRPPLGFLVPLPFLPGGPSSICAGGGGAAVAAATTMVVGAAHDVLVPTGFGRRRLRPGLEQDQQRLPVRSRPARPRQRIAMSGSGWEVPAWRRPWCVGGGSGSASTRVGGRYRIRLRRTRQRGAHRLGVGKTPLRFACHRPFDRRGQPRFHIGAQQPQRRRRTSSAIARAKAARFSCGKRLAPGQRLVADSADRVEVVGDGRGPTRQPVRAEVGHRADDLSGHRGGRLGAFRDAEVGDFHVAGSR